MFGGSGVVVFNAFRFKASRVVTVTISVAFASSRAVSFQKLDFDLAEVVVGRVDIKDVDTRRYIVEREGVIR